MEKTIKNSTKNAVSEFVNKPITRKDAIKKTGYMAISAATMMILLNNPAEAKDKHGPKGSYVHSNDQQVNQPTQKNDSKGSGIWK